MGLLAPWRRDTRVETSTIWPHHLVSASVIFQFDQPPNSLPHVREGNIKAYAVTAKARLASAPTSPRWMRQDCRDFTSLFGPACGRPKELHRRSSPSSMRRLLKPRSTDQTMGTRHYQNVAFSHASLERNRHCVVSPAARQPHHRAACKHPGSPSITAPAANSSGIRGSSAIRLRPAWAT